MLKSSFYYNLKNEISYMFKSLNIKQIKLTKSALSSAQFQGEKQIIGVIRPNIFIKDIC